MFVICSDLSQLILNLEEKYAEIQSLHKQSDSILPVGNVVSLVSA